MIDAKKILNYIIPLLIFVCIFDPADKLFSLKVPLFLLSIVFALIFSIGQKKSVIVNKKLLNYFLLFSVILPLISYLVYLAFFTSIANFGGIASFKTYLFLSFIFVIYYAKTNLTKILNFVLTLLAISIIVIYLLVNYSSLFVMLFNFGKKYSIYTISYSANWLTHEPYFRIYFWTSPLLIFSVTYYSFSAFKFKSAKYFIFCIINCCGMYISGSRVNQLMSILSVLAILYLYLYYLKKNIKYLLVVFTIVILPIIIYAILPYIEQLFSTKDLSNSTKLSYVKDYANLFHTDIKILLFGEGIGTDFYVPTLKTRMFFTELTYFELFRKFGLIFGSIYLILLLYPCILFLYLKDKNDFIWLFVSYSFYLIMSFFNPFLFSSSGIIILSVILVTFVGLDKKHQILFRTLK